MKDKFVFARLLKYMPKELSELEQARWLYIQAGKRLSYDMNAFYLRDEKLGSKYNEKVDILSETDTMLVCKPINLVYIQLLRKIGIDAKLVVLDDRFEYNHVGTRIKFKNGLEIFTDLTLDLYRIQSGMRTLNFAYTTPGGDYDILTKKELKDIDMKLGYTYRGVYIDDFFDFVSGELKNDEKVSRYLLDGKKTSEVPILSIIESKLNFILKHIFFQKLGYVEGRNLLIYMLEKCLTDEEKENISQYDLVRKKMDGINEFANCIKISKGKESIYYVKLPKEKMIKVSEDYINSLFNANWRHKKKKEIVNSRNDRER